MINIMLIEPDEELQMQFKLALQHYPDMVLVAETGNEMLALKALKEIHVDVIILDLELRQGSGILFLKKIEYMIDPKPFIMVVTQVESKVIFDTIRQLGVDYIWKKRNKTSSANVLLEIVEVSKQQIKTNSGKTAEQIREKLNNKTQIRFLRKMVEEYLEDMGFSYKYIGTKYLNEALFLVIVNQDLEMNVTKALYPQIAKTFNCNLDGVEKNIRVTIEDVWSRKTMSELKILYPYEWNERTGRPTNREFLRNASRQILK